MSELAPFLRNSALLLSLTFIYSLFIPMLRHHPKWLRDVVTGILFGTFSIFTMNDPVRMDGGGIMDARHVIVMVAAMVSGWRGGLVAALVSSSYRGYLGGLGTIPGINSILTAYLIGVIYHDLTNGSLKFDWRVILVGLIIPFVPLVWLTTMRDGIGWRNLPVMTPPLLIAYPITTYILMWLLSLSHQRLELLDEVWQFEQRQDATFQQTPTLLIGVTPEGIINNINPAAEKFLSIKREEVMGKDRFDVHWQTLPRRSLAQIDLAFKEALDRKRSQFTLVIDTDNKTRTIDVSVFPILNTQGEVTFVLMQGTDITDQLRVQQHELTIDFERERSELLQQLITDASHHLRTPMTIIGSSLYLLNKQLEHIALSDEQRHALERHLNKIEIAQSKLNTIVEDLLSLMRLDNTTQHTFQKADFVGTVREILMTYDTVAEEKNITLTTHIPDEPLFIVMAGEAFNHVVENLVENGLRYTPEGGEITVTVRHDDDCCAILEVRDTGVGIPEDDLKRIFDRFYRASNAVDFSNEGTGLGLSIVKKIVTLHGGEIEMDSTVNEGTTVTIKIPLVEVSAAVVS